MKPNKLVGQRFVRLVVVADGGRCKKGNILWECLCDCGSKTLAYAYDLRSGKVKSCGCYNREAGKNIKHGYSGKNRQAVYSVWAALVQRCTNPNDRNWHNYGGRGVSVCDRWLKFENFIEDMGERPSAKHSIDRINNDGNYEPGNCRWATVSEQNRNKRSSVVVTLNNMSMTLVDWATFLQVSRQCIYYWTKKGLSYGDAIERILSKKQSQEVAGRV